MISVSIQLIAERLGAFRCGFCLLVMGVQNPIHSILLLIRVFFIGTLLLFILKRDYFARLFLIVYVGAIVVLFLFIIRRLELKRVNVSIRLRDIVSYRYILLGLFICEVFFLLSQNLFDISYFLTLLSKFSTLEEPFLIESNAFFDWSNVIQRTDHLRALGGMLYTEYKSSILIASVLLFLARVGAIAISISLSADARTKGRFYATATGSPETSIKLQDINQQVLRHPGFALNAFRSN